MEDKKIETSSPHLRQLPFENLYLNTGLLSGYNSIWMYVLTVTFALIGYFFYQSIIALPLMARLQENGVSTEAILQNTNLLFDSTALRLDPNIVLLLELGMFVAAFGGLYAGIRLIHRKSLKSVLTGYEKFRLSRFGFAFLVWTVLQIILIGVSYLLNPQDFQWSFDLQGILLSALIMLVLMPLQTGFEEVFFRGYLVQGLSQVFKNGWLPMLIMALLFALAHMSNPEVKKYGTFIMFSYYAFFGLFLGMLTLLDEGIELAFGIHFANNIISSLLVSSNDSVIKTYSVWKTGSIDPLSELIVWFAMAVITFFIFRQRYKWRHYQVILK